MSATELLQRVAEAGVTLSYDSEKDRLVAKPTVNVTPEIVATLKDRRAEIINVLRPATIQSEKEVFDLAHEHIGGARRLEQIPGFIARGLEQASELGLVAKWARTLGYISIHDPTSGEWHDIHAKDAPSWARWEVQKRKELRRAGEHRAYDLTASEMSEIWEAERPEEGVVEEHPVEED